MIHSQAMTEQRRQALHYAEIKKRLYGMGHRVNVLKAKNDNAVPESRWDAESICFNEHIVAFFEYHAERERKRSIGNTNSMAEICERVLKFFPGITMKEIRCDTRKRRITRVRQLCCWEIRRQRPGASYTQVGNFIGREHTTILAAERKIDELMAKGEYEWYLSLRS